MKIWKWLAAIAGVLLFLSFRTKSKTTVQDSTVEAPTNERNQLVLTINKVIDERNQLLVTAKQEEIRANGLGRQLDEEIQSHRDDNFWNSIELNITRAVAVAIAVF